MGEAGVYVIINTLNNHRYIGSSVNIKRRWREHQRDLRAGKNPCSKLQNAWNKYSEEAFIFEVLEITERDPAQLCAREQYYLDLYMPEYNILPQAYSGNGAVRTEEQKEHLRQLNQGKKYTPEQRENHKIAMNRPEVKAKLLGRPKRTMSLETRLKMSATQLEVQNRPEAKEHQRQVQAGKKMPREAVDRAAQKKTGQKRSLETRERMSQSRLAWYAAHPEAREQQAQRNTGNKRSLETRQRMSASQLARYAERSEVREQQP